MTSFWRYVRIQLMVFVCGIVGPIFLVAYFAIQPELGTRWMYWWGLFITAADVLIALAIAKGAEDPKPAGRKPTTEELIEAASAKLRGPNAGRLE